MANSLGLALAAESYRSVLAGQSVFVSEANPAVLAALLVTGVILLNIGSTPWPLEGKLAF